MLMAPTESDEIQSLHRLVTYARLEAERLELDRVLDQLKLAEQRIVEALRGRNIEPSV